MIFYMKANEEIFDLNVLQTNFTLRLPFREANLAYDSPVSLILIYFSHEEKISQSELVSFIGIHRNCQETAAFLLQRCGH